MPEAEGGQELPYAGTPEMDTLLQQINANPQMLQVVGQNPDLLAEVMKHVGLDVNSQQLIDMTSDWPDEAAEDSMQTASLPPSGEETAEVPPTAEDAAEIDDEAEQGPPDTSVPVDDPNETTQEATATTPPSRNSPMPRSSNPIDDLISAQMMQSAVGNPNAPVPQGMQAGRQQRPAIPQSRQAPPSGGGPNERQQMIADIFRKQGSGSKSKKNARPPTR